jgi:phosphohistidine phosphatase
MRRLLLLRHAKAAAQAGGGDRERPLNGRGRQDALRIGQYLAAESLVADAALVSDSRRTRETLDLVLQALKRRLPFVVDPDLYAAPSSIILRAVQHTAREVASLLAVGHNPGIAELAVELVGRASEADLAQLTSKFPTSGLAIFDFEADDWRHVARNGGHLERFVTPALLGSSED